MVFSGTVLWAMMIGAALHIGPGKLVGICLFYLKIFTSLANNLSYVFFVVLLDQLPVPNYFLFGNEHYLLYAL